MSATKIMRAYNFQWLNYYDIFWLETDNILHTFGIRHCICNYFENTHNFLVSYSYIKWVYFNFCPVSTNFFPTIIPLIKKSNLNQYWWSLRLNGDILNGTTARYWIHAAPHEVWIIHSQSKHVINEFDDKSRTWKTVVGQSQWFVKYVKFDEYLNSPENNLISVERPELFNIKS